MWREGRRKGEGHEDLLPFLSAGTGFEELHQLSVVMAFPKT